MVCALPSSHLSSLLNTFQSSLCPCSLINLLLLCHLWNPQSGLHWPFISPHLAWHVRHYSVDHSAESLSAQGGKINAILYLWWWHWKQMLERKQKIWKSLDYVSISICSEDAENSNMLKLTKIFLFIQKYNFACYEATYLIIM